MQKRNPMTVCHTECEKYRAWRADLGAKKEHEKKENAYHAYQHDKINAKEQSMRKGTKEYKDYYGRKK